MTHLTSTPEHDALIDTAADFARREVAPHVAAYDREERFPAELVRKTAELGWVGAVVPPEYGGQGLDWLGFARLIEELSRTCHVIGLAVSFPSGLVGAGILRYGTEEQKRRWIEPLVRGETFAGAGVTEPASGTDVARMATRCRREGDEYVISGAKAWISMLDQADWFLTFATPDAARGRDAICAFVVERDTPGLSTAPYKNKLGFRPLSTGDLVLDEVRVPVENRIGAEGEGYRVAMAAVETGRRPRRGSCTRVPRRVDGVRARATGLRQRDRPLPARAEHDHRHGRRDRGCPADALRPRSEQGRGDEATAPRSEPGKAARHGRRNDRRHPRRPDPRRLRNLRRVPGGALLPRREGLPDHRRQQSAPPRHRRRVRARLQGARSLTTMRAG
jgi:alkylation response protein AidB-like acyl-CoA dehydrogenase